MMSFAGPDFPKVLLITRNHPPLRGGMERLNAQMFRALHARNPDCVLLGPPGSGQFTQERAHVRELARGGLPATLLSSMVRGIGIARRLRPGIVLAGSGLMAPAAVAAAAAAGATPMAYLHGLDIVARNPVYRAIWLPSIRRCRAIMVNSSNTRRLAITAGVLPERIRIVHPGTAIPELDPSARARFRTRHGIGEKQPVLLSVGRLTARKGMVEFVANVLPRVCAAHPDVRLVIIGDEAPQALHRGTGAGIGPVRDAAAARGLGDAVKWLGPCSDQELADAYQAADLHVFPGREIPGDVEGFGMVAIEAAAHGLPTVAFDVGGVADAVADGISGCIVPADDEQEMARVVVACLAGKFNLRLAPARAYASEFSWDRFARDVAEALANLK